MKNLFIPQKPSNIIHITTNSSSEIFVIGKTKSIESVDKIIDEGGWRWWFGEKKVFNTLSDVLNLVRVYPHAVKSLFGVYGTPSNYDSYQNSNYSPELKEMDKQEQELFLKYHEKLKENKEEGREYYNHNISMLWDKKREVYLTILEKWIEKNKDAFEKFVGGYWYECGEDNELSDWEMVHSNVPGKYCRLG